MLEDDKPNSRIFYDMQWADVVVNLSVSSSDSTDILAEQLRSLQTGWNGSRFFRPVLIKTKNVDGWEISVETSKNLRCFQKYSTVVLLVAPDGWKIGFVFTSNTANKRLVLSQVQEMLGDLIEFCFKNKKKHKMVEAHNRVQVVEGCQALRVLFSDHLLMKEIQYSHAYEINIIPSNSQYELDFLKLFIPYLTYNITDPKNLLILLREHVTIFVLKKWFIHKFTVEQIVSYLDAGITKETDARLIENSETNVTIVSEWLTRLGLNHDVCLVIYLVEHGWTIPGIAALKVSVTDLPEIYYNDFTEHLFLWTKLVSGSDASLFLAAGISVGQAQRMLSGNQCPSKNQLSMMGALRTVHENKHILFAEDNWLGSGERLISSRLLACEPEYSLSDSLTDADVVSV